MLFDYLRSLSLYKVIVGALVSIAVLVFALLGILLGNFNVYKVNDTGITGTIHQVGSAWGIEGQSYPHHKITLEGLPGQFQHEGTLVSCKIKIASVTGSSDWDVHAGVEHCDPAQ